jgi:hypothetical protein
VENGRVFVYCAGEKDNINKQKSKNSSSSGTEYGETGECLHSGEWWALPAAFMNCFSGFIVLYYYEVNLQWRLK